MKKMILFCLLFFFGSMTSAFDDTQVDFYKHSIEALSERGIISGYEDGNFYPNNTITRAEILKIILTTFDKEVIEPKEACFPDVSLDDWTAKYICSAYTLGIAKGFEDGNFHPNGEVTVLEALTFALRAAEITPENVTEGEAWHEKYRKYADEMHIIPKNAYLLDTLALRGQSTEILFKMSQISEEKSVDYTSAGCGIQNPLASKNTLSLSGRDFYYVLDLPDNYSPNQSYPLVIGIHGRTETPESVQGYMGISGDGYTRNLSPEAKKVIVVYPEWRDGQSGLLPEGESLAFVDAMVDEVQESLCVDRSKIYVVGHSMGSFFTHKVACVRGNYIRGLATVGGAGYSTDCSGPATSIVMHNPNDALASFASGQNAYAQRAIVNQVSGEAKVSETFGGQSCSVQDSGNGNPTAFCQGYTTLGGNPHSWPTQGSKIIYDFFLRAEE